MNASAHSPYSARALVIDTQSILDWQLFGNPLCAGWQAALQPALWTWLATTAMRDELAHVLGRLSARGLALSWPGTATSVLAHFDQHVQLRAVPVLPLGTPRCTDRDDQKFIDLAIATGALLLSRDKAVLKLRKRAALLGAEILPPTAWPSSQV